MISVSCRTNLDLHAEKWPTELPTLPRVGEFIVSGMRHRGDFRLMLEVASVTWDYDQANSRWYPVIELHMTKWQRSLPCHGEGSDGSIKAFYQWYAPKVGRTVGAFI